MSRILPGMESYHQEHPLENTLEDIFVRLSSTDGAQRGVEELRQLIEDEGEILLHRQHNANQSRWLPRFMSDKLNNLLHDNKSVCVEVIEALLPVEYCDITVRTVSLSSILVRVAYELAGTDNDIAKKATQLWGLLLENGCNLNDQLADDIARDAVERLDQGTSGRRYGASLLLLQVCSHFSPPILKRMDDLLSGGAIWNSIFDSRAFARRGAGSLLGRILSLVYETQTQSFPKVFSSVLEVIINNLTHKSMDRVHGSLIAAINVLNTCLTVDQRGRTVKAPEERIAPLWAFVTNLLKKFSQTNILIQIELLDLLPQLAAYDSKAFSEKCLPDLVMAAFGVFRGSTSASDELRTRMFFAIGYLAKPLGTYINTYLERMLRNIELNLVPSKKPKRERCHAAARCLAMLAKVDPEAVRPYVPGLLGALFSTTATADFGDDISLLCEALPEVHSECIDRMLELVTNQLRAARTASPKISSNTTSREICNTLAAVEHLTFRGDAILHFLVEEVAPLFSDDSMDVRRAVIHRCANLVFMGCFSPGSPCYVDRKGAVVHEGALHLSLIMCIQKQLVAVAVADPEQELRLVALEALGPQFDYTLSEQEIVRSIFPVLYDHHRIRLAGAMLLGRLCSRNAAVISPVLRTVLLQCVAEVRYFETVRVQEKAFIMLGVIIQSAASVIRPYVSSLFSATVDRLKDTDSPPFIQVVCLKTLGELVPFVEESNMAIVQELKALIVPHIIDATSPAKRQEAIRALGSIVRATRDIHIFDQFPHLLPMLLGTLHGGFKQNWSIRKDVLSLIGIIGALDPVRVKRLINRRSAQTSSECSCEGIASTALGGQGRLRGDEATFHVVVCALLDTLQQDATSEDCCTNAVSALVSVLTSKAMKLNVVVGYVPRVIPRLLHLIDCGTHLRHKLFQELTTLVAALSVHVRGYLDPILESARAHLMEDNLVLRQILSLLVELRRSLNEEFKPYLPFLLPLLVDATKFDQQSIPDILSCFEHFGRQLEGQLHIVLPCVLDVLTNTRHPIDTRVRAATTIAFFADTLRTLSEQAARCIHCICRVLGDSDTPYDSHPNELAPLHKAALNALCSIVRNLGEQFTRFLPMVRPVVLHRFGGSSASYQTFNSVATTSMEGGDLQWLVHRPVNASDSRPHIGTAVAPTVDRQFTALRGLLTTVDRSSEEGWKQWLRQLCFELLKNSPSISLQQCRLLATLHEPFARQLFHPAFGSCYLEMSEDIKNYVVAQLGRVLQIDNVPSEVLQDLLNLAEFMEREEGFSSKSESTRIGLFDVKVLADRAERCNLHAKALHYLEAQLLEHVEWFDKMNVVTTPSNNNSQPGGSATTSSTSSQKSNCTTPNPNSPECKAIRERWKAFLAVCERAINTYNVLGLRESANGVLNYVQKNFSRVSGSAESEFQVVDASMYQKLQWWSESYKAFAKRYKQTPKDIQNIVGMMTALDALGDFRSLLDMWKQFQKAAQTKSELAQCAPFGARAAWLLQNWDDLSIATTMMSEKGWVGACALFYNAVMSLHRGDVPKMCQLIDGCRKQLDQEMGALFAESYDRAYRHCVSLQQLSELEEMGMLYLRKDHRYRKHLLQLWQKRLLSMATDPTEWQGTLANHALVFSQQEELPMWLEFANICRVNEREKMSSEVLRSLLWGNDVDKVLLTISSEADERSMPHPSAILAAIMHQYETSSGKKQETALNNLEVFIEKLEGRMNANLSQEGSNVSVSAPSTSRMKSEHHVLAKSYLQLSEYLVERTPDYSSIAAVANKLKSSIKRALDINPASGSIWHQWAIINQTLAKSVERSAVVEQHILSALDGFVNTIRMQTMSSTTCSKKGDGNLESISGVGTMGASDTSPNPFFHSEDETEKKSGEKSTTMEFCDDQYHPDFSSSSSSQEKEPGVLQDVLGLLSLWFTFGGREAVNTTINEAIHTIPVMTWLNVIPQIIARLHTSEVMITGTVHTLLLYIAQHHPQVLLFPLNVYLHESFLTATSSTDIKNRQKAASQILGQIGALQGDKSSSLVHQAQLVSTEVIRVAVLWVEQFRVALDQWHDDWHQFHDHQYLIESVQTFCQMIDASETPSEEQFRVEYKQAVIELQNLLLDLSTRSPNDFDPLWSYFRRLAKKIDNEILPNLTALDLLFASPKLVEAGKNLEVVIPGQYTPFSEPPKIHSFLPSMKIISSKQRPRRLNITGSDGLRYKFLLKGHEDLRQDERVMQVLGLVNTVLEIHPQTAKRDLEAVCYSVTPLSDNAGLLGWVDDCTTIFDMLRDYRYVHRIPLKKEIEKISADISLGDPNKLMDELDSLPLMRKVEQLEIAQSTSDGMELARCMWERSGSAEIWLDRRTHYTRTLATMSMVGHILGLGDRHLQNLMIHSYSGKVIHIDFGDCFEVAQKRQTYPEKWPFRLTRLLVHGMEITGIDGLFVQTCESVMEMLRAEKDSLLAMLEAFVYDPLISWRLDENNARMEALKNQVDLKQGTDRVSSLDQMNNESGAIGVVTGSMKNASMKVSLRGKIADHAESNKAVKVLDRIRDKLNGAEFMEDSPSLSSRNTSAFDGKAYPPAVFLPPKKPGNRGKIGGPASPLSPVVEAGRSTFLGPQEQVQKLIAQATRHENLAQAFVGWCPFW